MTRPASSLRAFPTVSAAAAVCAVLWAPVCSPVWAQTHKVAKPENVVRAVGVYEWTGDMTKPNAMRLVPVSLFIDNHLEDAGVYLARPVPFALDSGLVYEVEQAGVPRGLIDLAFSRHLVPSDTASADATPYDDGWFGYGKFVVPPPPRKSTLRATKQLAVIDTGDDSRPHFSPKSATPGSGGSASNIPSPAGGGGARGSGSGSAPVDDPDRPTLHRSGGSQSGSDASGTETAANTPPPDPDRPTLHKSSSGSSGSSEPETIDDPDRPTLRRRTPDQQAKASADRSNAGFDVPSLNEDPNRPRLVRGKPVTALTDTDLPKLTGLPGEKDLHQMVAVSDAVNRPVHDFSRAWDDSSDRAAILAKMEGFAQAQLTAYDAANAPKPAAPAGDTRRLNSKLRHGVTPDTKPAAPPPATLLDEDLKAYTLTYGGPATYVYTAHSDGLGPTLHYVTLIAELDMQGNPQLALKSVTDAAHLDRTPRMRLVDAVDVEASNRGSLLFELREQNARQFALYRVFGGHADQFFVTGTTQ